LDVSHILESLNDAQREAVTAAPGSYLILAGAGSGKPESLPIGLLGRCRPKTYPLIASWQLPLPIKLQPL